MTSRFRFRVSAVWTASDAVSCASFCATSSGDRNRHVVTSSLTTLTSYFRFRRPPSWPPCCFGVDFMPKRLATVRASVMRLKRRMANYWQTVAVATNSARGRSRRSRIIRAYFTARSKPIDVTVAAFFFSLASPPSPAEAVVLF